MKTKYKKLISSFILGITLLGVNLDAGAQGQTNQPCTGPTLSFNSLSSNTFSFVATGGSTGTWQVFSTDDLNAAMSNWWLRGSITLTGSPVTFTDTGISGISQRFYKVTITNTECCSQAIGFHRRDVLPGETNYPGSNALIANQLYSGDNTLDGLFNPMPTGTYLPAGSYIMKWDGSQYVYHLWDGSSWGSDGGVTLNPGEGAFLTNPTTNAVRVSFVGLVQNGSSSLSLPAGQYNLISSKVPRAGLIQTVLGYSPNAADKILTWNGTTWSTHTYMTFGGGTWSPSQPSIGVGQAFFQYNANTANTWWTSFSGCPIWFPVLP